METETDGGEGKKVDAIKHSEPAMAADYIMKEVRAEAVTGGGQEAAAHAAAAEGVPQPVPNALPPNVEDGAEDWKFVPREEWDKERKRVIVCVCVCMCGCRCVRVACARAHGHTRAHTQHARARTHAHLAAPPPRPSARTHLCVRACMRVLAHAFERARAPVYHMRVYGHART